MSDVDAKSDDHELASEPARDARRTDVVVPTCRKRGYASEKQAKRANRTNGARLRAYLCPKCHRWHVTRGKIER